MVKVWWCWGGGGGAGVVSVNELELGGVGSTLSGSAVYD